MAFSVDGAEQGTFVAEHMSGSVAKGRQRGLPSGTAEFRDVYSYGRRLHEAMEAARRGAAKKGLPKSAII